jgi:hypothetical protein
MEDQLLRIPDNWSKDGLSDFIQKTIINTFATFENFKREYSLLSSIFDFYQRLADNLLNPLCFMPAVFFLRSHSAYCAGCRLSLSAQVNETYVVLRNCLEYALYAFYIGKYPESEDVWIKRHESEESMKLMKKVFQIVNLRKTLKTFDSSLCNSLNHLYDRCIDYGGHPNEKGVISSMRIIEGETRTELKQIYLFGEDSPQFLLGLKTTAQVGICALYVFRLIFKERFDILGLSEDIGRLAAENKL